MSDRTQNTILSGVRAAVILVCAALLNKRLKSEL